MIIQVLAVGMLVYLMIKKLKKLIKGEYFITPMQEKVSLMALIEEWRAAETRCLESVPSEVIGQLTLAITWGIAVVMSVLPGILCALAFPTPHIIVLSLVINLLGLIDFVHVYLLVRERLTSAQLYLSYVTGRLQLVNAIWLSLEVAGYILNTLT